MLVQQQPDKILTFLMKFFQKQRKKPSLARSFAVGKAFFQQKIVK